MTRVRWVHTQAYQAAGLDKVKILGIDANQDRLKEVKGVILPAQYSRTRWGRAKWGLSLHTMHA